ncbi:penicillin-binding transpeptidase domain-containing protein [Oerskovia flava]|uniref:penicillin-binding transpeptidase domain-containing protein n=1 Tax=Oerskovia flava TaxID=2986422 RepID=UPI00223F82E8|nr:penicillin-binding transpeptidase domain-containing protein [Oerskovia sp. JB1-3-2]
MSQRVHGVRNGRRPRGRGPLALAALPFLALALAACTSEEQPAPDGAAQALADGLASGDLTAVQFTQTGGEDAQAHREAVFEPLAEVPADVTVASLDVEEPEEGDPQHATVTLAYSWELDEAATWEYTTTAELAFTEPPEGTDGPGWWAVEWEPDVLVPDLDHGDRLAIERVRAERAEILGAGDEPIVTERDVFRIGIDKTRIDADAWDAAARELAEVVGIDAGAFADRVAGAGDKAFVEAITVRQANTAGIDVDEARGVEGASVIEDTMPLAPSREFASAILGRVGEATAEIVEESEGEIVAGDTTGLSGLQRQYDAQLRGVPGLRVEIVPDGSGGEEEAENVEVFRSDPVDGTPLRTTLRTDMQLVAEEILGDVDSASALVAIRPSTGEVLAAASGAGSEGLATATTGRYAPGSTFKVATTLAMLREGLTPESEVPCTPTLTVDGRTFQNVPGYPESALGDVPLRTAFANSCNTAMISQRDVVSQEALHDAAAALGLGVESDLGAPGFFGSVPTDGSGGTEHAASMIGQGRVEASPLAMATVAASVVAGHRVEPQLAIPEVTEVADTQEPAGGITEDEAATLRSLMESVVTDGSATALQGLSGQVGAKTGTAQYGDGSESHAWMIAFQDDLAVAVFVETGEGGAATAGPLVREFFDAPETLGGE